MQADTLTRAWLHRGALACLLWPLSMLMAGLVRLRKWAFHHGLLHTERLPVPVLVVGNRIVGGAGKTPTTIALVQHLQSRGWQPGVLSRGYGARLPAQGIALLDAEHQATLSSDQTGDEPWLIWRRTQAPMAIGRDRIAAGQALLAAHPSTNILVCDDGLQHLRLHRDIEVIVFDERGMGNGFLLPAGPMREPWNCVPTPGLLAAPLVVYNAPSPSTPLPGHLGQRQLAEPLSLSDWWETHAPHTRLQPGQSVLAMAGIAQPQRFFDALTQQGFAVEGLPLSDHADLSTLPWPAHIADLVVTEKDAVKLDPARVQRQRPHTRVWVAGLDFHLAPSFWQALDAALLTLRERHP